MSNDSLLPEETPNPLMNPLLVQRELWSSWAGVLRSYAAVHSLGKPFHAVVEVSEHEILLRYGVRWMQFNRTSMETSEGQRGAFHLSINGGAIVHGTEEPMDLVAERLAREIIGA